MNNAQTQPLYGDRTFAAAGSRLWNSLPVQLRDPDIVCGLSRQRLKRHLLLDASARRSVTSDIWRLGKTFTYFLTLHRARLVLRWVTVLGRASRYLNESPRPTQPPILSGTEVSTGQRAVGDAVQLVMKGKTARATCISNQS